ncbi:MAG: glycosyltransferase [Acidimicrobiales bacterium]
MTGSIRRRLGGLASSSLVGRGGLVLFATLTVVNGSNFLFHAVISRRLEPALYGGLSALLGILLVLTVPVGALQLAITRRVAARREAGEGPGAVVIGPLLADAVVWGVALSGLLVVAAPGIRSFLHLPTLSSAVMLGVYVLPAAIALIPRAVLLGQLRFRLVAGGLLAGAAARLALGVLLVERGAGIDGAMAATVLGEVVTAAVLLPALRAVVTGPDDVTPLRVRWTDATGAVLAFTGFWVLTGIDTLLARRYFPRIESGLYAAAATGARTAMFFSAAVSLVAFPRFAQGRGGSRSRAALVQALGAVAVLGFSAATATVVAPDLVVGVLFGTAYEGSSAVIGILALSSATLGVVNVVMYYLLATDGARAASWVWAGVAAAVAAAVVGDLSSASLAAVMLASTVSVALLMLRAAFASRPMAEERSGNLVSEELWTLAEPELDVTVVVPYFNPGAALRRQVLAIVGVLERCGSTYEVVAVSDGSSDGSERTIEDLRGDRLRLVTLPRNHGKGEALRVGLAMGRGRYVGFIDGDGDVDPAVLEPFLALVRTYEPDVVLGSKRHPLSDVSYPWLRWVCSWGFQQVVRVLFRLNIRDSQTGVKLVRREVLARALPRMAEKRFAFDLELFVVARHLGYRRFFEAPVRIAYQFSSTIRIGSVRGMFLDTLAIFYRLRLLGFYDRPGRRELSEDTAAAIERAVGEKGLPVGSIWGPSTCG